MEINLFVKKVAAMGLSLCMLGGLSYNVPGFTPTASAATTTASAASTTTTSAVTPASTTNATTAVTTAKAIVSTTVSSVSSAAVTTTTTNANEGVVSEIRFGLGDKYEFLPREEDGVMLYIRLSGIVRVRGAEDITGTEKYEQVRNKIIEAVSEAVEKNKGGYDNTISLSIAVRKDAINIYNEKNYDKTTGYSIDSISISSLTFAPAVTTTTTTGTTTTTAPANFVNKVTTTTVADNKVISDFPIGSYSPVPYSYNGKDYNIRFLSYARISTPESMNISEYSSNIKSHLLDIMYSEIGKRTDKVSADDLKEDIMASSDDIINAFNKWGKAVDIELLSVDDLQLDIQETVRKTTTTTVLPTTSSIKTTTTTAATITNGSTTTSKAVILEEPCTRGFNNPGTVAELNIVRFRTESSSLRIRTLEFDIDIQDVAVLETTADIQYSSVILKFKADIPDDAVRSYKYTVRITKALDENGNDIINMLPWKNKEFTLYIDTEKTTAPPSTTTTTNTTAAPSSTTTTNTTAAPSTTTTTNTTAALSTTTTTNTAAPSTTTTANTTEATTTTIITPVDTKAEMGDLNGDKTIDASDASFVLMAYALASSDKGAYSEDLVRLADVNGDNVVDARDASDLLSYYAGRSVGKYKSLDEYLATLKKA